MSLQSSVNQGLYSLAISKAVLARRNRDNELNFRRQQKQAIEDQRNKVTLNGQNVDIENFNPKIKQQLLNAINKPLKGDDDGNTK